MGLIVGIPKEIKPMERRVGLTPGGVSFLIRKGLRVIVQRSAGILSGYDDESYLAAGAEIAEDLESLYEKAELIQKVKEPQPSEFPFFKNKHVLFSFLHLASPENRPVTEALLHSGTAAVGFETLELGGGMRPILKPMSEIAGGLSAAYSGYLSSLEWKEKTGNILPPGAEKEFQKIASKYPVPPSEYRLGQVILWGGGVAGEKALFFALAMGARAAVVEKNPPRREWLKKSYPENLDVYAPEEISLDLLRSADVFIGSVHAAGRRAFMVLDEEQLRACSFSKRKIIMDIAIDQGGNFPFAHATTYQAPVYTDPFGNLRFSVANIPSFCGREASKAITEASVPYTAAMALNYKDAMAEYPELRGALNLCEGRIVLPALMQEPEERPL